MADHWEAVARRLRGLAEKEVHASRERAAVTGVSPLVVTLLENDSIVLSEDHDDVDVTDAVRRSDVAVGDVVLVEHEADGWLVTAVVSDRSTRSTYG